MNQYHDKRFPNESDAYRKARNELISAEMDLRRKYAEITDLRRELPLGGVIPEDYVFEEKSGGRVRMTQLFAMPDKPLVIYSFMYADRDDAMPCPACNSLLDGLNGSARHIMDRINFAVVAKAPVEKLEAWRQQQGWHNLVVLSSQNNHYNKDYFGESDEGFQIPALNVFEREGEAIYHCYNTELLYAPSEEGQHPRHVDHLWPVWNMFDMTRLGRDDWGPKLSY